jgi:hypothetical protein
MKPIRSILAAAVSTLCILHSAFGQGSLTPPGAPAPTMLSLSQVEPHTPISSVPFTISVPGSYYLTTNVNVTTGNAITIVTNGVTLDLNGFKISSTAGSATGIGILLNGGLRNITIANGFIQGGVTNNGSGVFSGTGFSYGIFYSVSQPVNTLVSRLSVSGCLNHGIFLGVADSTVVESCTVRTVGSVGIEATMVKESVAIDCGNVAILGDQVSDCQGQSSGIGNGIDAINALNCYGATSASAGSGISADFCAQNCSGYSGTGDGVDATTAINCLGSGGAYGVDANTLQNCNGSGGQYGIQGLTAENCYGTSGGGYGVYADNVFNCYGLGGPGSVGVYAVYIANSCYGYSSSGTGISALIACFCHGATGTGTPLLTSHNVNSF